MHNKDEENLQNRTDKGSKGVVEPPVEAEALQFFEEGVVLKGDRVGRDVLLHPVLPGNVRIPVLGVGGVLPSGDGRSRFVGLTRGSVESHHPVVRLLDNERDLVVSRDNNVCTNTISH